jgi:hypothetical protein
MKVKVYSLILDYGIRKERVIYGDQSKSNERTGLAWFRLELWKI